MDSEGNTRRLRTSLLAAVLIGVLAWYTKWPSLRLGLLILFVGQLGLAVMVLLRNRALAGQTADSQEAFLRRLRLFDNFQRTFGFAVLAYGFWTATRNLWLSLALGVLYPAVCAAGIFNRRERLRRTLR
ncbi:MAG TPA: hypothetical protein VHZ07_13865 [Bryobacteraceae bacterium]|jgi:hypothetical protein|nr:hypothetical protein [Bryobacteraceae bacterium]